MSPKGVYIADRRWRRAFESEMLKVHSAGRGNNGICKHLARKMATSCSVSTLEVEKFRPYFPWPFSERTLNETEMIASTKNCTNLRLD